MLNNEYCTIKRVLQIFFLLGKEVLRSVVDLILAQLLQGKCMILQVHSLIIYKALRSEIGPSPRSNLDQCKV